MDWLMAALIGMAGGASMEAIDVIKSVRWHRKMPWQVKPDTIDPPHRSPDVRPGEEHLPAPGWLAYCIAGVLRLFVSGALTGVIASSHPQVADPLVSFLIGLGALSGVEKVATLVPLAVKSIGRAALGSTVDAVQEQRQIPQQPQQPPQQGHVGPAGPQQGPGTAGSLGQGPQPNPDIPAQQDPTGTGGAL
ncbi:hypothetical protein AB0D78_05300 [Streptomyces avermitilis]|uniref:hypothetical protein n=2 Tax=Streptomyces avermitilis TaxID=33903 RepID=UPI0034018F73